MAGPLVKTCCVCAPLRFGSIVSGVVGIILAIVTLVLMYTMNLEYRPIFFFDSFPSWVIRLIMAINLCMTIFISTLLIIGAFKRNHYLMLPWVVLGITLAVGLLVSVIYTFVIYLIKGFVLGAVLFLILGSLWVAIYVYMWIVVYSHFTEIREEARLGRYNKQPYRR